MGTELGLLVIPGGMLIALMVVLIPLGIKTSKENRTLKKQYISGKHKKYNKCPKCGFPRPPDLILIMTAPGLVSPKYRKLNYECNNCDFKIDYVVRWDCSTGKVW